MLGLSYEEMRISDEGQPDLLGWYLKSRTTPVKATVVFLHGNAENISTHINSIYWLPDYGFDVVMVEYRGYGGSDGEPDVAGVHEDVRRFLREADQLSAGKQPLILYGQSLGASLALRVASENEFPLKLVVAEAGFRSYRSAAHDSLRSLGFFRFLFAPFVVFVSNTYSADKVLQQIKAPVLFVHGVEDSIVPVAQSQAMHGALADSMYWEYESVGHLAIFTGDESKERLVACFNRVAIGEECEGLLRRKDP